MRRYGSTVYEWEFLHCCSFVITFATELFFYSVCVLCTLLKNLFKTNNMEKSYDDLIRRNNIFFQATILLSRPIQYLVVTFDLSIFVVTVVVARCLIFTFRAYIFSHCRRRGILKSCGIVACREAKNLSPALNWYMYRISDSASYCWYTVYYSWDIS